MRDIEVFVSYAHEDEALRDQLAKQLRGWEREGFIRLWYDRDIGAGKEWRAEIDTHLDIAQVVLLLISPDFIASEYCNSVEVQRAMEKHEAGVARVVPILLRPVHWYDAPFGKLQALPKNGKPVVLWQNLDEAFFDVATGVREVIEELRRKLSTSLSIKDQWERITLATNGALDQSTAPSLLPVLGSSHPVQVGSIKITMLGGSAGGKTVFSAAAYAALRRGIDGFSLTKSIQSLDDCWRTIIGNQDASRWPLPTSSLQLYSSEFCYERKWYLALEWLDYRGGMLMERATEELENHIEKSSCIFLLISGEHLKQSVRAQPELARRADIARMVAPLSHALGRTGHQPSLVIVITKYDLIERRKEDMVDDIQYLFSPFFAEGGGWLTMICPVAIGRALGNNPLNAEIAPRNFHLPIAFSAYTVLRNKVIELQVEQQKAEANLQALNGGFTSRVSTSGIASEEKKIKEKIKECRERIKQARECMEVIGSRLLRNITVYDNGEEFVIAT